MPIYVNKNNEFEQAEPLARECPHCGAHAQLLPIATPPFAAIADTRAKHVGLVFRCAACNEPRFLRAAVRAIEAERIELAPNLSEVERARERFQYAYLPEPIEQLLRETLDCYTADLPNAFASMCRRTTRAALTRLDAQATRRWRDAMAEILSIGEIEADEARAVDAVLFGSETEPPTIDAETAAVLVEVIKDLFQQSYVRTAKLRAAIRMRRFFAGENRKITHLDRDRRELA